MQMTKSRLAIILSKLRQFGQPELMTEQYAADPEAAAEVLWLAYMKGDISGKIVADLGCGTGLLAIGAALLGARKAYGIDIDETAIGSARQNLKALGDYEPNVELIEGDVKDAKINADTVVQNPPFGTRKRHADRDFLIKAFETADVVYSFHKTSTGHFVRKLAEDRGFTVTNTLRFDFPLKRTHSFHRKRIQRIDVSCYRMERTKVI